ncbi:MAG: sensor histidine kinase [Eubacterium sp.]|nr:sensor histidine kinase [Eubacterium sp.]
MNIKTYLSDKKTEIILSALLLIIVVWLLIIFRTNTAVTIIVAGLIILVEAVKLILDYKRRAAFYNTLMDNARRLDQAYLVLETLEKPDFLEGRLLYDTLYEIDKSMTENVNAHLLRSRDFREYIELWIHEVKLPLSSISLKLHNLLDAENDSAPQHIETYRKLQSEVRRIESYVDQVLYYSRSENAEKDYHISEVSLDRIIHDVAMDSREALRDSGIDLRIEDISDKKINTDQKWLAFILSQLISNSIKYKRDDVESYIKISSAKEGSETKIIVEDNGIGIPEKDIKRVFEKTFTGTNGKTRSKSTGMGLYIVKTLCDKLGHTITIDSAEGEWTRATITITENEFYNVK